MSPSLKNTSAKTIEFCTACFHLCMFHVETTIQHKSTLGALGGCSHWRIAKHVCQGTEVGLVFFHGSTVQKNKIKNKTRILFFFSY